QPVVLFIDDFHWADTASVQLVAFLSLWLAQLRMLLIITSRSSELLKNEHPFAALSRELEVKGAFRQLRLASLSVDVLSEYVDLALPAVDAKEMLVHSLYRHSEGNPFFMISVLRYLKSAEALYETNGRWSVDSNWCDDALIIPPNVERFLLYTIEQLH